MTLEQLNLIRKSNGQEPLDKLPEDMGGPKTEAAAGKTPEEIEAERVAAEAAAKRDDKKVDVVVEPTDEELLAILAKRGIAATTLEDLRKKEEPVPELTADQKEAAELAFGLTKGLFTKAEYDQFIADSKDTKNLIYAEFYSETKAEDPTLTDEEIEADFLAAYGLDKDKDSYQFKRGVKKIKAGGEVLLKEKYKKIFDAKGAYAQTDTEAKNASAAQKKVASALPGYRADVDAIVSDLKKITLKVSDQENIELEMEASDLDAVKNELLNPDYYTGQLSGTYDKEKIKQAVVAGYLAKNFTKLSVVAAKKYLDKHKSGSHGVDLGAGAGGGGKVVDYDPSKFTPAQQEMIRLQKEAQAKQAK